MVFENKKYGFRSMNGPLSDEAAKMVDKLMEKMVADHFEEKEDEKMTKKFTEEEYQKIVDISDKYFEQHKELAVTVNLKNIYDYIFYNETVESKKIKDLNQEVVLIALPKSRDWAHDKFVEKEKKYYWKSKKQYGGRFKVLVKSSDGYPSDSFYLSHINRDVFTETEVREGCYNPDMFDREEVE